MRIRLKRTPTSISHEVTADVFFNEGEHLRDDYMSASGFLSEAEFDEWRHYENLWPEASDSSEVSACALP